MEREDDDRVAEYWWTLLNISFIKVNAGEGIDNEKNRSKNAISLHSGTFLLS